jgi:hypothetical protein
MSDDTVQMLGGRGELEPFSVRLRVDQFEKLRQLEDQTLIKPADLIRKLLDAYFAASDKYGTIRTFKVVKILKNE